MADEAVRLDPRLEELGLWPGFHTHYVAALAEHLNELLASGHEGRTMYLAKREQLLLAGVNLVELDFLLNGERMPIASPWPPADRFVLVARKTWPGSAEIYPIMKTEPLPAIRFPPRPPEPDTIVDLQQVLQTAWKRGHYDRVLKLARSVEPAG